jgi:Cupin domain
VFYILEGEVQLQLGDVTSVAHAGQLVRVPQGTAHGFVVTSDEARFLNFFVPAAMDEMVAALSVPATAATVPPPGAERQPDPEHAQAFLNHLQEMATLSWSQQPDLLRDIRHTGSG